MRESSASLVFDSQPHFRYNSTRFQFTNCCLQSRPNWRRYQIFLFKGDVVGLSVVTCYEASTSYAPTHDLTNCHRILYVMAFCCNYVFEQDFEPNCAFGGFLFPFDLRLRIINSAWRNLIIEEDCWFITRSPSGNPLVWNLTELSLRASHSNSICRYGTFVSTVSKSECILCNL
jgi:hypothetical protein